MKKAIFYDHTVAAAKQQNITQEEMLQKIKMLGFDGVELDYSSVNKDLAQLINSVGLEPSSVYAFFQLGKKVNFDEIEHFLYDVAAIGSRKAMIIPGDIADGNRAMQIERMVDGLRYACDAAKAYGITVLIENFDLDTSPCVSVSGLQSIFNIIPDLYWAFDTGNFIYSGQDTLNAFELLKDRLGHLHLKDRRLNPLYLEDRPMTALDGSLLYPAPAGGGILPIKECVEAVAAVGYDDYAAFEHFGAADQWAYILNEYTLSLE